MINHVKANITSALNSSEFAPLVKTCTLVSLIGGPLVKTAGNFISENYKDLFARSIALPMASMVLFTLLLWCGFIVELLQLCLCPCESKKLQKLTAELENVGDSPILDLSSKEKQD